MPKSKTLFESVAFAGYTWLVLERKEKKALLLKDTIIDVKLVPGFDENLFNELRYQELNWEISPYRELARTGFYEQLSQDAKSKILLADVKNSGIHSWFGGNGGSDTQDYVFFLSDQRKIQGRAGPKGYGCDYPPYCS